MGNAYVLEDLAQPSRPTPFTNPQNGSNLIKIDLPELDTLGSKGKVIEIYNNETDFWNPWRIRKMAVDGRVYVESVTDDSVAVWVDLQHERYRWVAEEIGRRQGLAGEAE